MRGCSSLLSLSEERGGDPVQKRISRCLRFFLPSFLPSSRLVSNSLDFLLLPSVPFDARENFRNFARPFKANTHGRRNEVPFIYFAVGTRARNKGRRLGFLPRFTSLRPGAFLSIGASVLTGTSRRRKQNRREERNRGPKFSVVRAVLCREFT